MFQQFSTDLFDLFAVFGSNPATHSRLGKMLQKPLRNRVDASNTKRVCIEFDCVSLTLMWTIQNTSLWIHFVVRNLNLKKHGELTIYYLCYMRKTSLQRFTVLTSLALNWMASQKHFRQQRIHGKYETYWQFCRGSRLSYFETLKCPPNYNDTD